MRQRSDDAATQRDGDRYLGWLIRQGRGSIDVTIEWGWPTSLAYADEGPRAAVFAEAKFAGPSRGAAMRAHLIRFAAEAAEGDET